MEDTYNTYICGGCFDDPGLSKFVEDNAASEKCSFCEAAADKPIAAVLADVVAYMEECILQEYDDPAACLPYDTREGGYQGEVWTSLELLEDVIGLVLPNDDDRRLFDALADNMQISCWCRRDPSGLHDEQEAMWSWHDFCRVVQHERRFFFHGNQAETPAEQGPSQLSTTPEDALVVGPLLDPSAPSEILRRTFEYASFAGLLVTLASGTVVFRARYQKQGESLLTAQELGPPPVELAR